MKLQFTLNKLTDHESTKTFKLFLRLLTILRFYTAAQTSHSAGDNNDGEHIVIKFFEQSIYLSTCSLNESEKVDENHINTMNIKLNITKFFKNYKFSTNNKNKDHEKFILIKVNLKNLINILKKYDQIINYKNFIFNDSKLTSNTNNNENGGMVGFRLGNANANANTSNISGNVYEQKPTAQPYNASMNNFMKDMLKWNELKKSKADMESKTPDMFGDITFKLIKIPKEWNIKEDKNNPSMIGLSCWNISYSEYILNTNHLNAKKSIKRNRFGFNINNENLTHTDSYESDILDDPDVNYVTSKLKDKYSIILHDFKIPIKLVSIHNDAKYRFENINNLINNELGDDGRIYALPKLVSSYNIDYHHDDMNDDEGNSSMDGSKFNLLLRRSLRFDSKFGLLIKFTGDSKSASNYFESYRLLTKSQYTHNTNTESIDKSDSFESSSFKILINDFKNPDSSNFHIELNWNKNISCLKINNGKSDRDFSRRNSASSYGNYKSFNISYASSQYPGSEIEDDESKLNNSANNRSMTKSLAYESDRLDSQHMNYSMANKSINNIEENDGEILQGDRILITNSDWKYFQKCYESLVDCQMYVHIGKLPDRIGKFCLINTVVPMENTDYDSQDEVKLMEFHYYIKGI
ncbi:uncharacterized protein HGUI_04012 [Hanseniaspora guilliermondii]|uniref:Uncharacterized protein n=1 Tax=Hanseniaspora guilliermondii TaxID=56406 RepID=A0A1L0B9I0_9ASCO|nr:uncharacterized protein HGUI_04012 [Hanseniaspora guilliermondii]